MSEIDTQPSVNDGYDVVGDQMITDFFGHQHSERHEHGEPISYVGHEGGNHRSVAHEAQERYATMGTEVNSQPLVDMNQIRQGREALDKNEILAGQLALGIARAGKYLHDLRSAEIGAQVLPPLGMVDAQPTAGMRQDIDAVASASRGLAGVNF